jgi:hypothetical protein
MNVSGCYDLAAGGTAFRTGSRWTRSFVSPEKSEIGEMDRVTEESKVVEYFSW